MWILGLKGLTQVNFINLTVFILEDALSVESDNASQSIIYAYVYWLYHARKHNSLLYFFCSKFSLSFLTLLSLQAVQFFVLNTVEFKL